MTGKTPTQEAHDLCEDTSKTLLAVDEVDDVYIRLEALQVVLDDDPLSLGPKRLQGKVSSCRKILNECERIFLEQSRKLHKVQRELRAQEAALELATKYLFAHDPEVRLGRNVSDREAVAAIKLQSEWLDVHQREQAVEELEFVLIVIRAKRSDLRDIQGRLRDQIRLCQTEIDVGSHWGSTLPGAPDLQPGQRRVGDADVRALDALFEGVEAELNLPALGEGEELEVAPLAPPEMQADPLLAPMPIYAPVSCPILVVPVEPVAAVEILPESRVDLDQLFAGVWPGDSLPAGIPLGASPSNSQGDPDVTLGQIRVEFVPPKKAPGKVDTSDVESILKMFD